MELYCSSLHIGCPLLTYCCTYISGFTPRETETEMHHLYHRPLCAVSFLFLITRYEIPKWTSPGRIPRSRTGRRRLCRRSWLLLLRSLFSNHLLLLLLLLLRDIPPSQGSASWHRPLSIFLRDVWVNLHHARAQLSPALSFFGQQRAVHFFPLHRRAVSAKIDVLKARRWRKDETWRRRSSKRRHERELVFGIDGSGV